MTRRPHRFALLALLLSIPATAQPPAEEAALLDPLAALGYPVSGGAAPGDVADRACSLCHAEIYRSYQEVGMARAFFRPGAATAIENFAAEPYYHEPSRRYYQMKRAEDGRYRFRRWQLDEAGQPIHEIEQPVDWVLGSGNHSRTYLFRNPAGELYQLPLAWYTQTGSWRMAPGFDRPDHVGLQRRVQRECMFCHNAYPDVPAGRDERGQPHVFPAELPEGIGCQRCHGPGAEHVRAALRPPPEPKPSADPAVGEARMQVDSLAPLRATIVNPARLPQRRRLDICYGCHMQPSVAINGIRRFGRSDYSFRPGEALGDYLVAIDVVEEGRTREDRFEINHHPYRLEQSACFKESDGRLDCLTCHDPHRKLQQAERAAHYRSRCLSCHTLETAHPAGDPGADCVGCHMPERRPHDVVQVTMTDHRIQLPTPGADLLAPLAERDPVIVDVELLDGGASGALAEIYRALPVLRAAGGRYAAAVDHLARQLETVEIDTVEPYLDLAMGQLRQHRYQAVLETAQEVLARSPGHPLAHEWTALALMRSGDKEKALELLETAVAENPQRTETRLNHALVLRSLGREREAQAALEEAVALRPNQALAWFHLGEIHRLADRRQEAIAAYRRALAIEPTLTRPYLALGELLAATGNRTEALRLLRHGVGNARQPQAVAEALAALD